MKLTALLTATLLTLTAAAPVAEPEPAAEAASGPFRLKAQYIAGNTAFGGQELTTYHTGAGFNAPVFTKGQGNVINLVNKQAVSLLGSYNYSLSLGYPEDLYAGMYQLLRCIAVKTVIIPNVP